MSRFSPPSPLHHRGSQNGFTLVELSIVLVIVALLSAPLFQLYTTHLIQKKNQLTKDNIQLAISAMAVSDPRYAPCPSDRSLPPTDPNFGVEQCDLTAIPNCNAGGIPAQGICKTSGSRDSDGNGIIDRVIIGGVPRAMVDRVTGVKTPILEGDSALDGYGQWLNYAVSQKVMDHTNTTGDNNFKYGVINAIDENGNATAGVTAPGDAEFVIWSSGQNGAGAYTYQGILASPCPARVTAGPPPNPLESENCNNDFTFMQGIGNYEGAGPNYLDDSTKFYFQTAGDLWAFAMRNNAPTQHIYNLNTGNVGINTPAPTRTLDVSGDLEVPTMRANTLTTQSAMSGTVTMSIGSQIAPPLSFNCQSPYPLVPLNWLSYSSGMMGGCNYVSIEPPTNSTVDCHTLYGPTFWVRGWNTQGCVICSDGATDRTVSDTSGTPCTP